MPEQIGAALVAIIVGNVPMSTHVAPQVDDSVKMADCVQGASKVEDTTVVPAWWRYDAVDDIAAALSATPEFAERTPV